MAKRKKRVAIHNPEQLQQLDEELSEAMDNLAQRNRQTQASLGKYGPAEEPAEAPDESEQSNETETENESAK